MPLCGFLQSKARSSFHRVCRILGWAVAIACVIVGVHFLNKHNSEASAASSLKSYYDNWWPTSCQLTASPGDPSDRDVTSGLPGGTSFETDSGLAIPRLVGGNGGSADVSKTTFPAKMVHCSVTVMYEADASGKHTGDMRKGDVFVGWDFKGLAGVEKCTQALSKEWPNLRIYKTGAVSHGVDDVSSWVCGNASFMECTWSSPPKKDDCTSVFTNTVPGGALAKSFCHTYDTKTTCFRQFWPQRCVHRLTLGKNVPCLVEPVKGGRIAIGNKDALETPQAAPNKLWLPIAIAGFAVAAVLTLCLAYLEYDDLSGNSGPHSPRNVTKDKSGTKESLDPMADRAPPPGKWKWYDYLTCGCARSPKVTSTGSAGSPANPYQPVAQKPA